MKPKSRRPGNVSIHKMESAVIIQPNGSTAIGWSVGITPCISLPVDADAVSIAKAVMTALQVSRESGTVKGRGGEGGRAFLKAARLRSWRDYAPIALLTVDETAAGGLAMYPEMRDGPGHTSVPGVCIRVPPKAPMSSVSRAIQRALEKSESAEGKQRGKTRGTF